MPTLIEELQWMLAWCEMRLRETPASAHFTKMEEYRRIRVLKEAIEKLEAPND